MSSTLSSSAVLSPPAIFIFDLRVNVDKKIILFVFFVDEEQNVARGFEDVLVTTVLLVELRGVQVHD